MWLALGLSVLLVAYNNLANRWEPFHRAAYVPMNLMLTAGITVIAMTITDLSGDDLGLGGDLAAAGLALVGVAIFGVGALMVARSRHGHRIADKRVAGRSGGRALAYYALVRIPLGTAVTEEVLFRGVLFALWRDAGMSVLGAALCAALPFGLWHVTPTTVGVKINDPNPSPNKLWLAVTGAVVLTTVAGLGLTWVRVRSGGLLAPILLHGGINSMGAMAAAVASHRFATPD